LIQIFKNNFFFQFESAVWRHQPSVQQKHERKQIRRFGQVSFPKNL
jgi:hypothetical protein